MEVTIDLENIGKIQNNIDALNRAIKRKPFSCDDILLIDVKYILIGIAEKIGIKIREN